MIETAILFAGYCLALMVMVPGFLVVGWMILQVIRINHITRDIHASASKRPYAHIFPMANFFDARVLNHQERTKRSEAFESLGRLVPTAFAYSCFVILLVIITSPA